MHLHDNQNPQLLLQYQNINYLCVCIMSKIRPAGVLPENAKKMGEKMEKTIGKTNQGSKNKKWRRNRPLTVQNLPKKPFIFLPAE